MKLKRLYWLLTAAQIVIAAVLILLSGSIFKFWWTIAIAATGVGVGVWAIILIGGKTISVLPSVRSTANLCQTGPFRFVRHPMYTALAMICGAVVLGDRSFFALQLCASLLVVLFLKTYYEERELVLRFPKYLDYKKRVRKFIPFVI